MFLYDLIYFRPLVSTDECATVEATLFKCFPEKPNKIEKPHWNVLKEMTKEQRKQFLHSSSNLKYAGTLNRYGAVLVLHDLSVQGKHFRLVSMK